MVRDLGLEAPTWLGTAFDIAGALDADVLATALLQWITRHETLRSGLRMAGQQLERFTLSAEAIALERAVVGRFSCGTDVVRCLEDRFDAATDPLTWPPYLFATVGREDGFTVYLVFDHSMVDGYSIAQTPAEIHELYAAAVRGRATELAEVGSYVDFSEIEHDAAEHLDVDDEAVVRWRDFLQGCGRGLPGFPLDLEVAPGEMPAQTGVCAWLLDTQDAAALDAASRAAGGNFLAGVLAVASLVAYERGGEPAYGRWSRFTRAPSSGGRRPWVGTSVWRLSRSPRHTRRTSRSSSVWRALPHRRPSRWHGRRSARSAACWTPWSAPCRCSPTWTGGGFPAPTAGASGARTRSARSRSGTRPSCGSTARSTGST